jgi:hypothetical protein
MNHRLRRTCLLLLQLWLVDVLPLVHASQESAELRQEPVLAAESSGTHGGACPVCALLSTPELGGAVEPDGSRSASLRVGSILHLVSQPLAAPWSAFGARAPPRF